MARRRRVRLLTSVGQDRLILTRSGAGAPELQSYETPSFYRFSLPQSLQHVLCNGVDNRNRNAITNLLSQLHQATHDFEILRETLQTQQFATRGPPDSVH